MTSRALSAAGLIVAAVLGATACVTQTDQLKAASAGHTGCAPEQLTVSNIRNVKGGLLWNAACNGKTYLCSSVMTSKSDTEYSCAPAQ
jgi:hypothetical protein